jgi:hypothetical protein
MIDGENSHCGIRSLPLDLTDAELNAAPVLVSLDVLVIEDLSDDEADAFVAALEA